MSDNGSSKLIGPEQLSGLVFTGQWEPGVGVCDSLEPATGKVLGKVGLCDAAGVAQSAAQARAAQTAWAQTAPTERAEIFTKAVAIGTRHGDEIVDWIVRESGSSRLKAQFELSVTLKAIGLAGAMPMEAQGLILPSAPGRTSLARRRPLGVVGVIAPFNFPLYLAMRAVAPALAVGNAVVLKPDPRTAICGGHVIARLFELAGLPAGVLHVLPGGGEAGEALCADPNVAMIQFTGSTAAGRMVGQTASRHLKKVSLELGGKNAILVLHDADLEAAAKTVAWGVYLHQGQICMSTGRVLVDRKILEPFKTKLAQIAASLPVGDPADGSTVIGPLINQRQLDHVAKVVADTVAAGATLETGGPAQGLFYAPTVLTGVEPGMPAFEEEIFGPVAVITAFDTEDQAVALANATEYGLSAAILSRDVGRAMALGDQLRTGLLHINDQTVNDDVVNPFGGTGASGNGTSIGGPANWEEFTAWQWTTIRATPPQYPF